MPSADVTVVDEKINRFLLNNQDRNLIALPIKPALLFNLLVIAGEHNPKQFQKVVLESLKKWYVTRRTREAQEALQSESDLDIKN
jgi:hypothetical protein